LIRRWMRRQRTPKNLGFFGVHIRGKTPWKVFSTDS